MPADAVDEKDALRLPVRITWGHRSSGGTRFTVRLLAQGAEVAEAKGIGLEGGEGIPEKTRGAWHTLGGAGDVGGVELTLVCPESCIRELATLHSIWAALIAQSDPDTARRLRADPALRVDPRTLTVQLDAAGTKGFTVTVDQLTGNGAMWVPSLDVYLAAGGSPPTFEQHLATLEAWEGRRVLDAMHREPEATYEQFAALWQDMGGPSYVNPSQPAPGHIVGLTWDGAVHKFGVDRAAGVWNDYGNPDRFHFTFGFADLSRGLDQRWKGQRLDDGLPILTTTLEADPGEPGRYEVEQFAYPLDGPPGERRGDMPMVLLQQVAIAGPAGQSGKVRVEMTHRRQLGAGPIQVKPHRVGDVFVFHENGGQRVLFSVEGDGLAVESCEVLTESAAPTGKEKEGGWHACKVAVSLAVPANGAGRFVVKLPSPPLPTGDARKLAELSYAAARASTREFWAGWLARGARFTVPQKVVNDLFRASLWHALRLPRRHGAAGPDVRTDLPYSNFAYDQNGTPWPVNQAVYVDYMIYALRGYVDVAWEELRTIYRNNQQADGRVGGYANWGAYTPSMVYTAARCFLLSQDREGFDGVLPQTLHAANWCLDKLRRASGESGPAAGLVRAPLNDLTGDGVWAFNQAYFYAGLRELGRALERIGHPRAKEFLAAADALAAVVQRAFAAAAMRSPLVQLRDHTWTPYVPGEATRPGRLLDVWYPTDVDTGAVHLLRLGALPTNDPLADCLLHDHEDNLFLHGWGMANEPVYNQQATAYLLRDDAKAVIRAFYSYMACAFSHSALEPVEHRWAWGQYFGPPSTDGAWFELYRNMLIRELDDDRLLLLQAAPRKWLADGQRIEIQRAPTFYGPLSLLVRSEAAAGRIAAEIDVPQAHRPQALFLRLRHPDARPIKSVTVNGQPWTDFDVRKEWVAIRRPQERRYAIVASY